MRELEEGWCFGTENLTRVTISPSNGQFKLIDDKYIVRKSDERNIEFDIFFFACRDIRQISKSYSMMLLIVSSNWQKLKFHQILICKQLENMLLQKQMPDVSQICEGAFEHCDNLTKVEIQTNSN